MNAFRFTLAVLASLVALTPFGSARGQREVRIGSFVERSDTDRSTGAERSVVLLSPTHATRDSIGQLLWGCAASGTLVFLIRPDAARYDQAQEMVWVADGDAPDTAAIRRLPRIGAWGLGDEDAAAFTRRVKTAARLVIRFSGAAPGGGDDFEYDLAGADSALDRLSCVRNPRPPRENPPEVRTYAWYEVEELPSPINTSEFSRALRRNYPRELRRAGGGGTVQTRFRILPDGRVDAVSITILGSPHEQLIEPTIRAVSVLRFQPARASGQPVMVWMEMPVVWDP